MRNRGNFCTYLAFGIFSVMVAIAISTRASDYGWDESGVVAYERGDEMELEANIYEVDGFTFVGFSLNPYDTHLECAYASVGADSHELINYSVDGYSYTAYIFCEPYDDGSSHYYTFVTMDAEKQQKMIELFSAEFGIVELRIEGMIFDLPTAGFNAAYKARRAR